jgi:hypothetical protein
MAEQPKRRGTVKAAERRRERAAALRAQGLTCAAFSRRLGVTRQAAWRMPTPYPAVAVHRSACQAVVTTRDLPLRTLGPVLCRECLAAHPDAPFALRLRSHRFAAGMSWAELERAAGQVAGRVKDFEECGVKPWAATRARLAKVLRAPDLERFVEERQEDQTGRHSQRPPRDRRGSTLM